MQLTIVASYESVTVVSPELAVHKFLRLFKRDIHVAVYGLQFAWKRGQNEGCYYLGTCPLEPTSVNYAGVKLDCDRSADDFAQEARWISGVVRTVLSRGRSAHRDNEYRCVVC